MGHFGGGCSEKIPGESGWDNAHKYTWQTVFHQQHFEHRVQTRDRCCANVWQKYGLALLLGVSVAFWYCKQLTQPRRSSVSEIVYTKEFHLSVCLQFTCEWANLHNERPSKKKKKKIQNMLQIIVSTGCSKSFPPPWRAVCVEIMFCDDSDNSVPCKVKDWKAWACIWCFRVSGCAELPKAGHKNWTRKIFCLRQGQMLAPAPERVSFSGTLKYIYHKRYYTFLA